MSNPDRGAYTPPTDQQPLSFDARQPVRGRGPAPMMLFASALVLVVLIAAIAVFYRTGASQGAGAPPVVGQPVGSIKGAAPPEAQPADPAAGLQIYQQAEGQAAPAQPNFTQGPETPQSRTPPPPPVVAAPPPAPAAAAPAGPVAALPATGLKPAVTAAPPPPPVAKTPAPAAPPKPAPVAVKPAPTPTPTAKAPAAPPPAAKPAPVPAKPAATAAKPAAEPKAPAAAAGAASVQIGAFSSQALADKGWNDAAHIAPGAAAGKGKKVEAVQKDGATLYRTQVTGFASRASAQAFCDQLKAAGKSCFVK